LFLFVAVLAFAGCGQQKNDTSGQSESREAKQLLQGIWSDEDTEAVSFKMKGDTVYYADSLSMPALFRVVGDTLFIGDDTRYAIEKHSEHVLWLKNSQGEVMKFRKETKDDSEEAAADFSSKPKILSLTEVLKRDTVITYNGERYHIYVVINPTKYKVVRHTVNEDGMEVENVYYDNIIHLSVFHGATSIFSRDFRKQYFVKLVPEHFMSQSILNDMQYDHTDAKGFHFHSSLCIPDDASCYQVEIIVDFNGKLTSRCE
jgi:hypothetical protein